PQLTFTLGQLQPTDPMSIALVDKNLLVRFETKTDKTYTLKSSTDLQNWSPILIVTGDGTIQSQTILDVAPDTPNLFFYLEESTSSSSFPSSR
ncbi:MAG: hypothetical protein AAGD22_17975, partial [Verrucomicrobiota bacterium]